MLIYLAVEQKEPSFTIINLTINISNKAWGIYMWLLKLYCVYEFPLKLLFFQTIILKLLKDSSLEINKTLSHICEINFLKN